jgi:hypothetical protein
MFAFTAAGYAVTGVVGIKVLPSKGLPLNAAMGSVSTAPLRNFLNTISMFDLQK